MNRRQIIASPANAFTRNRFPGVWPLVPGESRFDRPGPVIAGGIPGNVLFAFTAQP